MRKQTIALIVDMENWAFDIEAKILQKSLEEQFKIDIFVSKNYNDDLFTILEETKKYDIIHFFWRKILLDFEKEEFQEKLREKNYDYAPYVEEITKKISTGVYDHLFLEEENQKIYQNIFTKYSKKYYVCSKKLQDIYERIDSYPKPWGVIHDTYDNNLYDGGDKNRYQIGKEEFVVGWVGNSNWNLKYKDFKGFHSILNPVLDSLIEEGYKIKKHFADRNIKFRTNEEMPSYYQELDVCIITSTEEGTPRPVLEAMASGVPIIATDVGIVQESFGPKQKEYILGTRTIENDEEVKEKLREKIIDLYNNRSIIKELSEENYKYSKANSIDNLKNQYIQYFEDFLNQ